MARDASETLQTMVDAAAEEMARLAGGMAVCTFTKAGKPVLGIKYAEGRWASLRELQRAVAKGTTHADAAAEAAESWRKKLTALEDRGANKDWIAYHHGGVDALAEFAETMPTKD